MNQSGDKNYKKFALDLLSKIKNKPISFEVFADNLKNMETQAREIATLMRQDISTGKNPSLRKNPS
jgi:transaldolase